VLVNGALFHLALLMYAPVASLLPQGVGGFFAGLGAGLVGAVVLPVAGVVTGVGEIVGTW